jgi:hypothetical protein
MKPSSLYVDLRGEAIPLSNLDEEERKHLAIDTLEAALAKIGCTRRIMPLEPAGSARW